jgi:uncharacterized protein
VRLSADADTVIEKLGLEPLLPEGGWFRRIYYKKDEVSLIYYLLRGEDFSEFHVLPYPEHYLFLMGDPVELYTGLPREGILERTVLGTDILAGEVPSFHVDGGKVQGSRLVTGGEWALLSTMMNPPFEPDIYRPLPAAELMKDFPGQGELIKSLVK